MRAGRLTRVLPATFCRTSEAHLPDVRAAAICAADDTAVLTGRAAAALTGAVDAWPETITFSTRRIWRLAPAWARPSRQRLPEALVGRDPLPHVSTAVALLQVAAEDGAGIIDNALRKRAVTPEQLQQGVTGMAGSAGNARRRRMVASALQRPWSSGERELHELLRSAGIQGWFGNLEFQCGKQTYFLDVAFPERRIAIELDGWSHHSSRGDFEADRRRGNELALAGWLVLRVTPTMVREEPHVVLRWVRAALRPPE